MRQDRVSSIANQERLGAFLCVLVVVAGAIVGLMFMIGFGFLPFN